MRGSTKFIQIGVLSRIIQRADILRDGEEKVCKSVFTIRGPSQMF